MRVSGVTWLMSMTLVLVCVGGVSAQARAKQRTIVLVMESPGGPKAATELRRALTEAGNSVMSLVEAQRRGIEPDALVTVASDVGHILQVRYWDRDGRSDSLASPAPLAVTADQLSAMALALSSALLDRHRQDAGLSSDGKGRVWAESAREQRAIYAMLGHLGRLAPRTNVQLRFEDF